MRPTFIEEGLSRLVGHWSPEEIAATGAAGNAWRPSWAIWSGSERHPPEETDKAKVTAHLKERLAENPEYDEWRVA
jgi:hypothetical protein